MARAKKGGKSDSKGQITIKFAGECWVCGRPRPLNNRTAGTIRTRSPKAKACSEVDYGGQVGEVRALRDQAKGSWVEHRKTGEVIIFIRRGGKFENDVEVKLPNLSGNGSGRALL